MSVSRSLPIVLPLFPAPQLLSSLSSFPLQPPWMLHVLNPANQPPPAPQCYSLSLQTKGPTGPLRQGGCSGGHLPPPSSLSTRILFWWWRASPGFMITSKAKMLLTTHCRIKPQNHGRTRLERHPQPAYPSVSLT